MNIFTNKYKNMHLLLEDGFQMLYRDAIYFLFVFNIAQLLTFFSVLLCSCFTLTWVKLEC